jgi:hypothetical protein
MSRDDPSLSTGKISLALKLRYYTNPPRQPPWALETPEKVSTFGGSKEEAFRVHRNFRLIILSDDVFVIQGCRLAVVCDAMYLRSYLCPWTYMSSTKNSEYIYYVENVTYVTRREGTITEVAILDPLFCCSMQWLYSGPAACVMMSCLHGRESNQRTKGWEDMTS